MITAAIQSVCEMVKQFFQVRQTDMENKPTLEIVKDKKDLKKATNYAEKIFRITDKYTKYFNKTDLKNYENWKRLFEKYN
jgi:hypothetical protein